MQKNLTTQLKNLINTPFNSHEAVELVRNGADPDTRNDQGESLLHLLAKRDNNSNGENNSLIKELVETFRADINIPNAQGLTPLQCLISGTFRPANAMELIRLGANPNVIALHGSTLLQVLCNPTHNKDGKQNPFLIELLTTHHADPKIKNKDEKTPLQFFLNNASFCPKVAMELVRRGADPDTKNDRGESLLHLLAKRDNNINGENNPLIKELVETFHADINITNAAGLTPLQCLISGPFRPINAMALIHLGANPNVKALQGSTLLYVLCNPKNNINGKQNTFITELLTTHHADPKIKNQQDKTPLQIFLNNPSFFPDIAMELVRRGADPDTKNDQGESLLHLLVKLENNIEDKNNALIKELIEIHHANPDIQNKAGVTPLQYLISSAPLNTNAAMTLVRCGANPNAQTEEHGSLLCAIAYNNSLGENNNIIDELHYFMTRYDEKYHHEPRNEFLNLMIFLANDRNNDLSKSYFKMLPPEIMIYMASFFDFHAMGTTQQERYYLADAVFAQYDVIKQMTQEPGGINVMQHTSHSAIPAFTFFHSAKTVCKDYEKLKKGANVLDFLNTRALLKEFRNNYAISYWEAHSALYKKSGNKEKLFEDIKDTELYKDKKIKVQMLMKK